MKQIKFTVLEKPLGINNVYGTNRYGIRYLISKGKEYKKNIGWEAKQAMYGQEMFLSPMVTLHFYFDRRGNDIDGPIKLVLDSMNEIVWKDDSQIVELHRIEITVEEYKSKLSNL